MPPSRISTRMLVSKSWSGSPVKTPNKKHPNGAPNSVSSNPALHRRQFLYHLPSPTAAALSWPRLNPPEVFPPTLFTVQ